MIAGIWRPKFFFFNHNLLCKRVFSTSGRACTVFDPTKFCEPIVDIQELNKPLPEEDSRRYLHPKPMGSDQTPVFYRNEIVDKMIRMFMRGSNKEVVRTEVYAALEHVKSIQYKKWLDEKDEEKRKKIILDPFEIAEKAILNCRPVMELREVFKAGTIYHVPFPLDEQKSIFRALQIMRKIFKEKCKHGKNRLWKLMAHELIAAMNNEGMCIQAKQELHRLCEANRAYSAYRKF